MSFERDRLPDPMSYFEGVGLTLKGPGPWKTTECRFHGGSDSMRINTRSGAWVCMACGAKGGDVLAHHMEETGQQFIDAAKELGAWIDDGRPAPTKPRAFSARDALTVLVYESQFVGLAASNLANGVVLTDDDRARLLKAAGRILTVAEDAA